jgi:hypothetical protein
VRAHGEREDDLPWTAVNGQILVKIEHAAVGKGRRRGNRIVVERIKLMSEHS